MKFVYVKTLYYDKETKRWIYGEKKKGIYDDYERQLIQEFRDALFQEIQGRFTAVHPSSYLANSMRKSGDNIFIAAPKYNMLQVERYGLGVLKFRGDRSYAWELNQEGSVVARMVPRHYLGHIGRPVYDAKTHSMKFKYYKFRPAYVHLGYWKGYIEQSIVATMEKIFSDNLMAFDLVRR